MRHILNQCRKIDYLSELREGEKAFIIGEEIRICDASEPLQLKKDEELWAVKPVYAQIRVVFYSLSKPELHKKFDELKESIKGWRLIGTNLPERAFGTETTENCASLAFRLLGASGFLDLLKLGDESTLNLETSSFVNPDDLVKYVILAKAKEYSGIDHGNREKLRRDDETPLEELVKAYQLQSTVRKILGTEESLTSTHMEKQGIFRKQDKRASPDAAEIMVVSKIDPEFRFSYKNWVISSINTGLKLSGHSVFSC